MLTRASRQGEPGSEFGPFWVMLHRVYQRILSLLLFAVVLAQPVASGSPLASVNALREAAGLPLLQPDEALNVAAGRHAGYLDRHRDPGNVAHARSAHEQTPGLSGFSGTTPMARALAAGYPHRGVLENVSMGYELLADALDGLMSALYHRLTFLDMESDQLGIAEGERARVFLLGRTDVAALCRAPPADARFQTPVDCLGEPMTRDHYASLCADLGQEALFRSSHPSTCANGRLLDAHFMRGVCEAPPRDALFIGFGRYYMPCENGTKIDAEWFDALCAAPPADAAYDASGSYYEICEPPRRVFAEWLEGVCRDLPDGARYLESGRYRRPCAGELDVAVEYLDRLDELRRRPLPAAVLWPPRGATSVPPAFFIEEPDPLPDLEVSGYPVSVQFNPGFVDRPLVRSFRLWRLDAEGRTEIREVRLLDAETDPNKLLSRHEFALFPLQRLNWGTDYEVELIAETDGKPYRQIWRFTTRGSDRPMFTIDRPQQRIVVQTGQPVWLYLPPTRSQPHTVLGSRVEHLRANRVKVDAIDPNTLEVRVEAQVCDRIKLAFEDRRQVELIPAGCAG